jgi:hypothetical protein
MGQFGNRVLQAVDDTAQFRESLQPAKQRITGIHVFVHIRS